MKKSDQETIHLLNSMDSLLKSISHRDLSSPEVSKALRNLRNSAGFKRIIGELSKVHVVSLGGDRATEGAQRFRKSHTDDYVPSDPEHMYTQLNPSLISSNNGMILQVYKGGEWQDATWNDLPTKETDE